MGASLLASIAAFVFSGGVLLPGFMVRAQSAGRLPCRFDDVTRLRLRLAMTGWLEPQTSRQEFRHRV